MKEDQEAPTDSQALQTPSSRDDRGAGEKPVVILVHGIRDFALWQDTVRASLERAGFRVELTNYGRLNLVEFLLPIWFFRRRAIETVWRQIRIIKQNNP